MRFSLPCAPSRRRAALTLALAPALVALPATGQDWLQHPSGDIRSYHLDWLAVCEEGGAGDCRAVYAAPDIGSDAAFDRRLTLRYDETAGLWTPEIMDRGMPAETLTEIAFAFDEDAPTVVPSSAFVPQPVDAAGAVEEDTASDAADGGDVPAPAASDTAIIVDPAYRDILLAEMRAGRRLMVTYQPVGAGDGEAELSLFGLRAAMAAVEARVAERDEES